MKGLQSMALLLAGMVMLPASGCGVALEKQREEAAESVARKDDSPFAVYVSNTDIATGNNTVVAAPDGTSYRAYLPVEAAGEYEYCFYFSNAVDSTWADGQKAYVGMEGSAYTIQSASIGYAAEPEGTLRNETAVTFGGAAEKEVAPAETFWSDAVTFAVPEGNYLVWTWTVQGETIPANEMSGLTPAYYSDGSKYIYAGQIPLPQLFGCKRTVQKKIGFIGDSITQGCGTSQYGNAFWVADLAQEISGAVSVWNLGLGYARASDCVQNGDWLQRAAHMDTVFVAFGTNDMVSGQYGVGAPNTAGSIEKWLRKIVGILQEAGCEVVILNAPPFDFADLQEGIRTELNAMLPTTAEELGVPLFDFASVLEDPENPQHALYGGHPDDAGCRKAAEAMLAEFKNIFCREEGES